jgi:alginate O-acetyltransferase complex protein AlgI
MLFLEIWFWIFAAVAVPVYWLCPRSVKVYWLLAASLVFHYHFAGPAGMAPVIVLGVLTYGVGLLVSRSPPRVTESLPVAGAEPGSRRWLFTATWMTLVGALAFYKYGDFVVGNFQVASRLSDVRLPPWLTDWRQPMAPLGISFFTFEFVHYLYEVRVHGRAPIRNPVHFSLFAIFFPTLAAGPIKRFPDFVPQLAALHNPAATAVWPAARRIIRGLFKKICIADLLVEAIKVFEQVPQYNGPIVVLLAVLQGFRIYYDFAGYTDIAIGLAQLLNLRVPENFDRPYFSTSLQEFWRRWHMSLSSWIRDYIYIPLGGNRAHRALNLLTAMVLCGLWHGAAWNFAFWGLYHGMGMVVEAGVRRVAPSLFGDGLLPRALGWLICYAYVCYGWLIFFYPIGTVVRMTKGLLVWGYVG